MPQIRGKTVAFEGSTVDAGLTIPVCNNQTNDLLVAFCISDGGAIGNFNSTPPAGWSILDEYFFSIPVVAYFRLSDGAVPNLAVTAVTAETYSGCMISYEDVDTASPVGVSNLATYATSNQDSNQALGNGTIFGVSQSFTTPAATVTKNNWGCFATVDLFLKKVGSPTGNMTVKIYAHSGVLGTSSVPTGVALATSQVIAASTLTTSYVNTTFYFPSPWVQFAANTNYVVSIEYSGGDGSNYVDVGFDASAAGAPGNKATWDNVTWTAQATQDCCFTATRFTCNFSSLGATALVTMATITTRRNNSIVTYAAGNTGTVTPSYNTGPVYNLIGMDGTAEGMAVGWNFRPTAGTSAANVILSSNGTTNAFGAVIEITPPVAGATIIPTYVAQDDCTYIDPVAGSAFNGNTNMANTADTNYAASIGGFTTNDPTVSAVADYGINSFHSVGALTSAAVVNTMSGADLVIAAANRFNFSSKNLLAHIRAINPSVLQRFPSANTNRGAWFGVRSNVASGGATTGWKVWQFHAVDSPFIEGLHIPILINNSAGNTIGTSGTLDPNVITSVGFWVGAIGALTVQFGFCMLWLMDKTIVAGGNTAFPMTLDKIVDVVGQGKERRSAILQGAKQAILYQEIQIGNNGTNPVNLNLDATAIEFPRQYNKATAEINYNSVDNKIGLLYLPGASDVIKHTNSIISSRSRYKWGIAAGASASASWNFSGLSVIGAGTITLNLAITVNSLTINDFSTLDLSSCIFNTGSILTPPVTNNSVTVNSTTQITNSAINTTTITAGNYLLSTTTPNLISGCTFTGSASSGHAIRITTPGTYTLTGNVFNSYGADTTTSAAIYNDSGGLVTLNISGGVGSPTYRNGVGATTVVNNNKTITLTGLKNNTEVRVYTTATITEVAGIENATDGASDNRSFSFSLAAGSIVDIRIHNVTYVTQEILAYTVSVDASIPIQQQFDRNYKT